MRFPAGLLTLAIGCGLVPSTCCKRRRAGSLKVRLGSGRIYSINAKKLEAEEMNIGALELHVLMAIVTQHPNAYGVSIQDHLIRHAGYEPSIGSITQPSVA
jgi:hypothetical protein